MNGDVLQRIDRKQDEGDPLRLDAQEEHLGIWINDHERHEDRKMKRPASHEKRREKRGRGVQQR